MRIIYVAGPYRGDSESRVWANIMAARDIAIRVWQLGYVAICPHLNTMLFGGELPDSAYLQGDLEIIARCDAIVLVPGWETSAGTQAEIEYAQQLDIPVYQRPEDLPIGGGGVSQ